MKIKRITFEMGADFHAVMECEHCGHDQPMRHGYHDGYFHDNVIPAMPCQSCGLDRAGRKTAVQTSEFGTSHV